MVRPSRLACTVLLGLLLGSAIAVVPSSQAQELIQPRVKDRKFPQDLFCPLPIDGSFIADGPNAIIRFSTNVFYQPSGGGPLIWTQQFLDNICVAPLSVYNANLGPSGGYSASCYSDKPIPDRFYFQNAGTLPLKETFDTDPVARGWDLTDCSWDATSGAPNSPGPGEPSGPFEPVLPPLGCLGLGQDSATPDAADSAVAAVTVSGLVAGNTYVVSGWWDVRRMDLDEVFLTLRVYGNKVTPIERRTWGGLKRRYR